MRLKYNILKKAFCVILGVSSLTACDFLETDPYDFAAPETFYSNETECTMALAGVYWSLATQNLYGNFYSCEVSNVDDLSYYTRTTNTAGNTWSNEHTPSSERVWTTWQELYIGIKNANMLIENVDKASMSDELKLRIKGEAKFLRAYYHFLLAQAYYDVPLRKEVLNNINQTSIESTPHADLIDWVIAEMEDCISMVDSEKYDAKPGHVKKTTVEGMLSRVCLWRAGYPSNGGKPFYDKAAKYAKAVYDSKKHDLNPDLYAMWTNMAQDKYDTKYNESMWEVEFVGDRQGNNYTESRIGNVIGNAQRNGNTNGKGYTYAFYAGTLILWDLFEEGDNRRDLSLAPYWLNASDKVLQWSDKEIVQRRCGKFRREWELGDYKNKNWTPENYPILRYADVLLMLAEAENEANNGPTALAYTAVNKVRSRAGIKEEISGLSYDQFKQLIQDERGRELCFESLRKYDLVRWGIYVERMSVDLYNASQDARWAKKAETTDKTGGQYTNAAAVAKRTTEQHQFLPIPAKELGVNTKLEQNKYWK